MCPHTKPRWRWNRSLGWYRSMTWILTRNTSRRNSKNWVIQRYPIRSCHPRRIPQRKSWRCQSTSNIRHPSWRALQSHRCCTCRLGSKAQTKLEMMLDKMEPMKFHEIMHFENLLMLYGHLESQYDISPQMDILQKKGFLLQKLSATLHSLFDSETHQLPYTKIHTVVLDPWTP